MKITKKRLIIAGVCLACVIAVPALVEWKLKQPIRRDFDDYRNVTVEATEEGINFYTASALSGYSAKAVPEPLGFDEDTERHWSRLLRPLDGGES